jgi:hypothetical protein
VLYIASDTANVNLFVLAGSPVAIANVTLIINSGVTVYSTVVGTAALLTNLVAAPWAAGTVIKLVNNGSIVGKGSDGSAGTQNGATPGTPSPGSAAVEMRWALTIDNTYGTIAGGGQGGMGGKGLNIDPTHTGGGGGGGGAGNTHGVGGLGTGGGTNGTSGSLSGGGTAGVPGVSAFGSGGAAHNGSAWGNGNAVLLHGFAVTWLGGNNPTQLQGAVS